MPSPQNLRAENRRLREQLAETVDDLEATKVELAEVVDNLKAVQLELTKAIDKLTAAKEKLKKRNELVEKHLEWTNYYACYCFCYGTVIETHFGNPPRLPKFDDRVYDDVLLASYMRPSAKFAPQILLPTEKYTIDRQCLMCGTMIPHSRAIGRCVGCPRKAWYCSGLCQRTHWPIHSADHKTKLDGSNSHEDFGGAD